MGDGISSIHSSLGPWVFRGTLANPSGPNGPSGPSALVVLVALVVLNLESGCGDCHGFPFFLALYFPEPNP